MPVGVTDEQRELAEAVAAFASRHAPLDKTRASLDALAAGELPQWWDEFVANGFHAVHLADDVGGQGGTLADTACVVEAAATALLPGVVTATVVAGAVATLADDTPAARRVLGRLAAGTPAAVVHTDGFELTDGVLSGASTPTLSVCAAGLLLVAAHDGDAVVWCVVDPADPAVTVDPRRGTDLTTDVGVVRVAGLTVTELLTGIGEARARCVSTALHASAASGLLRWCVDAVTEHLRTREQFGKPIGTFQALQHQAAMLLVNSELATSAAWDAVRALDESPTQQRIAAAGAALVAVAPAAELVLDALTMFGAIGFTWEHDLHLYWRRAISLGASLGPANRIATELGDLTRGESRDAAMKLGDVEPEFRARVAAVLDEALTLENDGVAKQGDYANLATGPQRTLIAEAGLIQPHWPAPWGVDATPVQQLIIDEEFEKRPSLVRPSLNIAEWVLPTLLSGASQDVQARLVPSTMRGETLWCQLFSEPGAGSDLASLTTRASRVHGGWRVNGHKIWTSSAQWADFGALLARTDPDAPKHRGIGYFVVDMRSEGVELEPIRTATGDAHFNEVFLRDVFVPDEMLLGGPTDGWSLAIATMAQERVAISGYVNFDRSPDLRRLANSEGVEHDPVCRALGELDAYGNAIKALAVREVTRLIDGQAAGPASSIAKVAMNVMLRRAATATLALTAPMALVDDDSSEVVEHYLHLPAELIGGGTKEIQLNIIAQMILGLPRK